VQTVAKIFPSPRGRRTIGTHRSNPVMPAWPFAAPDAVGGPDCAERDDFHARHPERSSAADLRGRPRCMCRIESGRGAVRPARGGRRARERLHHPSAVSEATRVVALDERQHHQRGHQARSGVDAARGDRRLPELRRVTLRRPGGREAAGLHDTRVERRVPLCDAAGRPARSRRGHCRFAWLERIGRTLGHCTTGHEEAGVERDARAGRPTVLGCAPETADGNRTFSERRARGLPRGDERSDAEAPSRVLPGQRGRGVSRASGRCAGG
jgi:hypothetical protein